MKLWQIIRLPWVLLLGVLGDHHGAGMLWERKDLGERKHKPASTKGAEEARNDLRRHLNTIDSVNK